MNREAGHAVFVNKESFEALELCEGKVDIDLPLVPQSIRDCIAHNERCRECPYRNLCLGGCRAAAMQAHPGDILAIDELTCALYRDGWLSRIAARVKNLRPTAECMELKHLELLTAAQPALRCS